ncbi:NAD-dependent epimerase/dehydratase family protein [Smaragdicoccus niigatensis]|uniref:NAD-dependent epimerase/dehydratase family protein n=1 Tax=Smaragdicoccus niigatensis TaxID=359359 RepID=UPI0012DCF3B1|nr:SDR family NAD(P)-dependent oxidoreductase [Smaragdicoccus niigatensis]
MTTTALVTGAAGFIGSRLAASLLESGVDRVVGVDRLSDYYDVAIKRRNLARIDCAAFEFVEGDLLVLDLVRLLDGVDVVFHEAAQAGVQPAWGRAFDTYVDDNIRATRRLLEAVVASGNRAKIVNASSSSVYGDVGESPVTEDRATNPLSPYGVTKLAAEQLVSAYAHGHGIDAVSLRYFTVYGPSQRPDMAFARMCTRIHQGLPIEVFGTGDQVRDFTYIDDVVRATILAWQRPTPTASIINIAGGSAVSLNDCIDVLAGLHGEAVERITHPHSRGDARRTNASTARAAELLGWFPLVSIETGLKSQFEATDGS